MPLCSCGTLCSCGAVCATVASKLRHRPHRYTAPPPPPWTPGGPPPPPPPPPCNPGYVPPPVYGVPPPPPYCTCQDWRGRTLFKNGKSIRSENQKVLQGFSSVKIFVEETDIKIFDVRSHSKIGEYEAAPVHTGVHYYIDRDFVIQGLPDFLHGVMGVKTANDDKHSPATDLEFLCFVKKTRQFPVVLLSCCCCCRCCCFLCCCC